MKKSYCRFVGAVTAASMAVLSLHPAVFAQEADPVEEIVYEEVGAEAYVIGEEVRADAAAEKEAAPEQETAERAYEEAPAEESEESDAEPAEEAMAEQADAEASADGEGAEALISTADIPDIAVGAFTGTLKSPVTDKTTGITTWDCLWYGNYWQDTDTNGDGQVTKSDKKSPVKWRVLWIDSTNKDITLLADKLFIYDKFCDSDDDDDLEAVTWDTSYARKKLNDDSSNKGFLFNLISDDDGKKSDALYGALKTFKSGNSTDRVSLLSLEDVLNPNYGFSADAGADPRRVAPVTKYLKLGSSTDGAINAWYLRTKSETYPTNVITVSANGAIDRDGQSADEKMVCYRPVIHLDFEKTDQFSYAGTVKSDGTADEVDRREKEPEKQESGIKNADPVAVAARKAGKGDKSDTGLVKYESGRYVLEMTGNSATVTVAKGNKFFLDGGLKGSYATPDSKLATINQKGLVRAKKGADKAYFYYVRESDGQTVTVTANIMAPKLNADLSTGCDAKKLGATVYVGKEFDINVNLPLNTTIDEGRVKKGEILEGLVIGAGGDGKLHMAGKAVMSGTAKIPLIINGTSVTVKIKAK